MGTYLKTMHDILKSKFKQLVCATQMYMYVHFFIKCFYRNEDIHKTIS